jgi:site-specific DNA-adenine methylase
MSKQKNHFIYGYAGNKREEVEGIVNKMDMTGIKRIVEPFCGTSALSFYIAKLYPTAFTYHINDVDPMLIDLYKTMQDKDKCDMFEKNVNAILSADTFCKETYNKIIHDGTLEGYFIRNKVYAIRQGLFRQNYVFKEIKFDSYPVVNFLRTEDVTITCGNGVDVLAQYENDKRAIVYLDPPYIQTCNDFYHGSTHGTRFNVYEYIYMKRYKKSNIYATLEDVWIVNLVCQHYNILDTYAKLYQGSKKKTSHHFYRLERKRRKVAKNAENIENI